LAGCNVGVRTDSAGVRLHRVRIKGSAAMSENLLDVQSIDRRSLAHMIMQELRDTPVQKIVIAALPDASWMAIPYGDPYEIEPYFETVSDIAERLRRNFQMHL
jgi:hypothetical protein